MSLRKQEEDFTELVDAEIPKCASLVSAGKFGEALEKLLMLEKKTRQGGDAPSTSKVLKAVVEACHTAKEYNVLNDHLVALAKRRGLLKEPVKQMVIAAQNILSQLDYDTKMKLTDTLLIITEGKIFVEKQRARIVLDLAHIRESEGKIDEAAKLLQEVQVETFGTMKKQEKTEYILEQMRLCLRKNDFVRTQIISRKIHPRVLNEKGFEDIKIRFNKLMIQYHLSNRSHLEVAKCYWQIYQTEETEEPKLQYLQLLVLYAILAAHDNEQSDFANRTALDANLEKVPQWKKLLKLFLTDEVMNWKQIEATYKDQLVSLSVFQEVEEAKKLWDDLKLRVIEHNIRVISKYYSRIRTSRLANLLDLSLEETEERLSKLVVEGSIYARIHRPRGLVVFQKNKSPNEVMNAWSADLDALFGIVENTCHLIQRENMVHKVDVA